LDHSRFFDHLFTSAANFLMISRGVPTEAISTSVEDRNWRNSRRFMKP
jgi:hypothetical protein